MLFIWNTDTTNRSNFGKFSPHYNTSKSGHPKLELQQSYNVHHLGVMNVGKKCVVLLYILERCSGKTNVGKTVLYKLLYFSDFNYYELAFYRERPFSV
ncbi:MAG: hypothetical protein PHR20_02025 [Bacteroidales bacterium]|nr:hypothetical protein [Bacteroidales bacterium]